MRSGRWIGSTVRAAQRHLSTAAWTKPLGLLNSTYFPYYTKSLDLHDPAVLNLLKDRDLVRQAVHSDAISAGKSVDEYLAEILTCMREFLASREIWDRDILQKQLRSLCLSSRGTFALLLGGRSVGKSLLLSKIAKEHDQRATLQLDARAIGPAITAGILDAISDEDRKGILELSKKFLKRLASAATSTAVEVAGQHAGVPGLGGTAYSMTEAFASLENEPKVSAAAALIEAFVETHNKRERPPLIIIDEVNEALVDTPDLKAQSVALLKLFTRLSKQENKLNVVLASSDDTQIFRFEKLGFSTAHLTETIYMSEIPPTEMLQLLTTKWKVGPALAHVLVGCYGGHIWTTSRALTNLAAIKDEYRPEMVLPLATVRTVLKYVSPTIETGKEASPDPNTTYRQMLEQIAHVGFMPLSHEQLAAAGRLSRDGVANVVARTGFTFGLDADQFGSAEFGLVPTTQATRLIIARCLADSASSSSAVVVASAGSEGIKK